MRQIPGNVHVFANGHRFDVKDFERSAAAAAGPLRFRTKGGARIVGAVRGDCGSGRDKREPRYCLTVRTSRGSGQTFSNDCGARFLKR